MPVKVTIDPDLASQTQRGGFPLLRVARVGGTAVLFTSERAGINLTTGTWTHDRASCFDYGVWRSGPCAVTLTSEG